MMTPLVHVTLPELDDNTVESHFAPLVFMLEGLIKLNEWHITRSIKRAAIGRGVPFPPLYSTGVYYQEDPPGHEDWRDAPAILQRFQTEGKGADCVPLSSLVLRDDYETVPLGSLQPGDRIMGDGAWTQVLEQVVTGGKQLLAFRLSNGCTLRCTPEHRIFRDVDGRIEEIRASEAKVGDDLITPSSIPISPTEDMGWTPLLSKLSIEDRNWLLGVFVADGWTHGKLGAHDPSRFAISGLDGKPKEAQKRRVEELLSSIGLTDATRWHRKYIAANNREMAEFFAACGHTAPNKHLSSLRLGSEAAVRAALDGLAADAGYSETGNPESALVYGTTSPKLAIQLRILYRMLGISVSIRRVDDHGGFGEHPIYRVVPRLKIAPGTAERRDKRFARIRSIADGGVEMCGDITTDSGRFWLPESDTIVHNCDQLVCWRVAELRVAGVKAEPVIKWQHLDRATAIRLGYSSKFLPADGLWLVHCCVRFPDGSIEDTSKNLGMGGSFTSKS